MKKIIFLLFLLKSLLALSINDIKGNYICKTQYENKSLTGKTITKIKRDIQIKNNKFYMKEHISIDICPKSFIIIGPYKCYPQYRGTIITEGKYKFKNNRLISTALERKTIIKDDLDFKRKYEHKKYYDRCNQSGLEKMCYKSKNIFEKQWNKKAKQIRKYKKEDIILIYKDIPLFFKDKLWNLDFECDEKL